jgi:folate-binding protein YgfZ
VRNWYEIWLSPQNAEEVWKVLQSNGAAQVGAEALELQRVLLGLPRVGIDIGERELPQETAQDYALHAAKGCYIGQEIVERVRSRGQVHRRLTGLVLEGALPEHGAKMMAGDKEVGEVTSSAELVVDGVRRKLAIGYVRRNLLPDVDAVQVEGSPARLTELPFRF